MLPPWNFSGVKLRIKSYFLAIDNHSMFPNLNVMRKSAVCGIISEEILEIFGVHHRVIDSDHIESFWVLEG